jgi:hypothetical protein
MPFGFDDAFVLGSAALKIVPTLASVVEQLRKSHHKDESIQKAIQIIKQDTLDHCKDLRRTLDELDLGLSDMRIDPKKSPEENRASHHRLNFPARIRINSVHAKLAGIHMGLVTSAEDIAAILTCLGRDDVERSAFEDAKGVKSELDAIARSGASVGNTIDLYKKVLDRYIEELSAP